jgi:hypothetical protein
MKQKCKLIMGDSARFCMLETHEQRAIIMGYQNTQYTNPTTITYGTFENSAHFTNRIDNHDSMRIVPERMGQPL